MKSKKLVILTAAAATVSALALAGCAPSANTPPAQDEDAPLTIWVDDTRSKPAQAYVDANDLDATVESVDSTQGALSSRLALATKAGDDLPDVVFLPSPDEIASILANPVNFPAAISDSVGQDVLDGYAGASIDACTFGGKVYCLPNDIAQTVLYYNKPLFEQFGYEVPATFDDWLALGTKLAAEHPGYSLGSVNGRYGLDGYFGSSQCQYNDSDDPTTVTIDLEAEECTRVADVIGPLMANGTLSTLDPFDPTFTTAVTEGKLLASISPSWMGPYGIKPNSEAEGQWAVAPMPTWSGADKNYSGAVGGGIWVVSAESKNVQAAIDFVSGLTGDTEIQATAPTYPANIAAADAWLEAVAADAWYAEDPSQVLKDAAGALSPTQGYVRYQTQLLDAFNSTVIADAGADTQAALGEFATQANAAAESTGYTVSK